MAGIGEWRTPRPAPISVVPTRTTGGSGPVRTRGVI
jgi:hypothetical protein